MRCAIWYYLYNFKKREKYPWGSVKINTPPWVFFTFLKLYKWYQIAQRTTNCLSPGRAKLNQGVCQKSLLPYALPLI